MAEGSRTTPGKGAKTTAKGTKAAGKTTAGRATQAAGKTTAGRATKTAGKTTAGRATKTAGAKGTKTAGKTTAARATEKNGPVMLRSFDPTAGKVLGEVPAASAADVRDAVERARKVAPEWAAVPPEGRARMLREVRHRIYRRLDRIVETVSSECGKPRAEALAHDVMPSVLNLFYYERTAAKHLKTERIGRVMGPLLGLSSQVEWRPFGVVGCITPWNYPFFLSFMAITPALFAGNTVILKPSEVTPQTGELLRDVLEPLPPGVATVVQGGGDVGAALVAAPCDKICFIGSPGTGKKIAAAAAQHLTPVVMELGGKDPAIVCADADLDIAASGVLWGAFLNAGQTCAAIERAFVVDSVADEFQDKLLAKLAKLRQGEGDADVGSLTFDRQLDVVRGHVEDAVANGAQVLAGGPDAGRKNADGSLWYAPTVLTGVDESMKLMEEETFGPVLPIIRVQDEAEAIRRVNNEGFNLTASVWTSNRRKGREIAGAIRAGTVSINDHAIAAGAPWSPWGGVGESGYGRLSGELGLKEFLTPVHITNNMTPRMKRLWWYPYDDATTSTLRAVTEVFSAPTAGLKMKAGRSALKGAGRAIRSKL